MSGATKRAIVYVVLVGFMFLTLFQMQRNSDHDRDRFERAIIANCETNKANAQNLRAFVVALQANYAKSTTLTPAERADRIASIEPAKPSVPRCPPHKS